jgi:hypothetical protein
MLLRRLAVRLPRLMLLRLHLMLLFSSAFTPLFIPAAC